MGLVLLVSVSATGSSFCNAGSSPGSRGSTARCLFHRVCGLYAVLCRGKNVLHESVRGEAGGCWVYLSLAYIYDTPYMLRVQPFLSCRLPSLCRFLQLQA